MQIGRWKDVGTVYRQGCEKVYRLISKLTRITYESQQLWEKGS